MAHDNVNEKKFSHRLVRNRAPYKGSLYFQKAMNFRKISERGGGHFRSKKFRCVFFCFKNANFGHDFPEKRQKKGGVISDLKNFVANLVRFGPVWKKIATFFSEKGAGGGGARAVRKFSGNSSLLGNIGFPKIGNTPILGVNF